ncbi:hypothetical protein BH11CYA1_BH11CYA1_22230 [soil metagenome]
MDTEDHDAIFTRVWKAFRKAVKSDNAACNMIFRSLRADGRIRCTCSQPQIKRKSGARFYICMNCKSKYWFTSGTLFEGAHCLRAWLAAVWFKDRGVVISSSGFAKLLEIAQSTALNMHNKVGLVLYELMDEELPVVAIKRLIDVIIKRSRDSPAACHPKVEVDVPQEDILVSPGEGSENILPACVSGPLTGQILVFLRHFFHGVSKKYLQLYIVAFCCFRKDAKSRKYSILQACLRHPPINYEQLLAFSSPRLLKIDRF